MGLEGFTRRGILYVLVIAALLMAARPCLAQRGWHQGDMWLKWKGSTRESYLLGYFNGYSSRRGNCEAGPKEWQKEVNTSRIAESITEFYRLYPEDREIDIAEVLEQLGNGLTLEQIHNYPFMRHTSPSSKAIR
jgi:hypothetical protein